jgi:hypothetical protein
MIVADSKPVNVYGAGAAPFRLIAMAMRKATISLAQYSGIAGVSRLFQ